MSQKFATPAFDWWGHARGHGSTTTTIKSMGGVFKVKTVLNRRKRRLNWFHTRSVRQLKCQLSKMILGFADTSKPRHQFHQWCPRYRCARWARSVLYFKFIGFDFLHFVPVLKEFLTGNMSTETVDIPQTGFQNFQCQAGGRRRRAGSGRSGSAISAYRSSTNYAHRSRQSPCTE